MKKVLLYIFTLGSTILYGQSEVFHDFTLLYEIKDTEKWYADSYIEWKQLYGDEGWRRWSIQGELQRKFGVIALGGGLKTNYTFDKSIVNFLEIRPFVSIELKNHLTEKLVFLQKLTGEFRNFWFNDDTTDFNFRTRYNIALEYPLKSNENSEDWILSTELEWYLLRNKNINERYINSKEYSVLISKLINDMNLIFGLRYEDFSNTLRKEEDKAITFILQLEL